MFVLLAPAGVWAQEETEVRLSIEAMQSSVEEGEDIEFRLTASVNLDKPLLAVLSFETERAGLGWPYDTTAPAYLAIEAGTRRETFTVPTVENSVSELDGVVTVRIEEPHEGALAEGFTPYVVGSPSSAEASVRNNDARSTTIDLTLNPTRVTEQGGQRTVTVTATLNAGTRRQDTVVNVTVAGDTAEAEDFAAIPSFNVTIPATQPSGQNTFSLRPVNDVIAEGNETLQVSGTSPLTVTPATLTLSDDDTASTEVELNLNPTRVTEQGGQQTVTVTAALNDGARTQNTVVQVSVAGNTATVGDDFGAVGSFSITIPVGATSAEADFSLTPVNDTIVEGDETLQVSGTSPLPVTPATLTLSDDDTASTEVELSLNPTRVTEQGGQQTVTVTAMLNAAPRVSDTLVNVTVTGITAALENDFGAVGNFSITIPANQPSGQNTFSLTPVNDTIVEGDETLRVSGTSPLPVTPATLTLSDDDTASTEIELTLSPTRVTEQGGQQTVTVTAMLNAGSRIVAPTVVNVTVTGNTATVGDDFGAVGSFSITIPVKATSAEADFSLTPVNDTTVEGDETLQVSGTSPLPVTPATLTLSDDDTASTGIELTLNPMRVTEQGGQQTVTVTAALNAGSRVSDTLVNVTVAGDTATVGDDFGAVGNFSISIPANQPSGQNTFSLTPVNDVIAEGDETLQVSGTSPLPVTPATLTLSDDDTASTEVELTLNPMRVTEQGGQQTVTVTAALNAGSRVSDTLVNVTVAGDTATVGDDFGAVGNFSISIPANQPSGQNTFSLTPVNDVIAEGNETLQVSGTSPLTVTPATLTLSDDDTASTEVELTLNPMRVTEQGGQQTVTVTAMLNAGSRVSDTLVNVTVAGDTATVGDDFGAVGSFSITIPANQPSGQNTFSLTPVNDTTVEGDETLQVSGTSPLPVDGVMLTISDDDTASTRIELSLNPTRVTEQGGQQTVTVTAMLNAGSRVSDTLVNVTVAGDTATVGDDFGAVGNFSISIPANQPSGQNTFSLTPVNDVIAEGDETLQVSGTSPLPVDGVMLTISDDDTASTGIELSLNPMRVTEQGGQQTVTVTAALNAGSRTQDTVVQVSVAGDTATVGGDFGAVGSFSISIPAEATNAEADFSLTPVNDVIAEGDETLQVSGTSPLPVTPATLTLSDDDTASSSIALSLNPTRVTEQGGQQTVTVTAMLNAGSRTQDTVVQVSVAGDTATVGDDFGAVGNFSISIPANQPSGQNTFSLTPVNDVIAEGDETLQVSGTSPLPVGGVMLTISDDDTASTRIELSLNPTRVTEQGGQQTVTVTAALNAGSRVSDTLVNVTVAGDTATVGDDFGAVGNFSISIPANQPSGQNTFSLTPVNDVIAEGNETLQVSGTSLLTVTPATLTLSDDDTASTEVELTLNPMRVTEQGGQQTVTVTAALNAGSRTQDTVVQVSVAGDTATVGDDFGAVGNFSITIPANQPSGQNTFSLTPVNDVIAEGDETLQVSGTSPLTVTPATLTLSDDDTASTEVELSLNPTRVTEQGGQQTVTVTAMLNAGTRVSDTLVNVTVAGDTATVGDDFGAVGNFSISIPANQPSGQNTFSLTPVNDVIAEGDETLQVSGTSPLPVDGVMLTISDDDTASTRIELSLNPTRVTEQGGQQTVTVTAALNAGSRVSDTLVNLTVAGDTATVGDDFGAVGNFSISIPANQPSGQNTFSLTPVNDVIAEGDETLQVSGTSPLPVDGVMLTISDDDTASTRIELSLNPTRVTEQGGQQTVTVTAALNARARVSDTLVNVTVTGDTATVGGDFGAVGSFSITIPAEATNAEADFSLTPVNDVIAEGNETLQVSGTSPLPVTPATLTLSDDDTVPSTPRNLEALGGDEQVTLFWEAPEDDGGFPVTDYEYLISGTGGGWISTESTETTHTVTELTNGRLYVFQVRAVSAAGAGASSHQVEVTPGVGRLEFAHFANGSAITSDLVSSITSDLVLVNVLARPIRPSLYFYDREGERIAVESVVELTEELEVAEDGSLTVQSEMQPLEALTISTHGQGELVAGSVTVVSNGPMGGVLRFDLPGVGVAGVGAGQPLTDALFPARRQAGAISTAAAIRNLEAEELVVSCQLMQEGAVLEEVEIELQANGQDGRYIEEVFTATDTTDFVGLVRCTAPAGKLFAGVAVELDAGQGIFTTLPVLPVDPTVFRGGEYALDFAHFANGASITSDLASITSDLVLVNVSIRPSRPAGPFTPPIPPTRPSLYFYDRAGERLAAQSVVEVTGELEVAEDGGLTIQSEMQPLQAVTISTHGRGELVAGSVRVVAEGPLGGVLRFDLPGVGVAGVGAGQPLTDALFPARRQAGGISTAAAIRNLEAEELVVSCRLMQEGIVLEEEEITLEVNGQDGRYIEEVFTRTDTTDFVGLVRCTAEGEFAGVAVELDAGNGIFTTLPVVPVPERMSQQ